MEFKKVSESVLYCGINDYDRVIFDELIPLDNGTTYNSYLVKGADKVAIIDTMYPKFTEEYLKSFDDFLLLEFFEVQVIMRYFHILLNL